MAVHTFQWPILPGFRCCHRFPFGFAILLYAVVTGVKIQLHFVSDLSSDLLKSSAFPQDYLVIHNFCLSSHRFSTNSELISGEWSLKVFECFEFSSITREVRENTVSANQKYRKILILLQFRRAICNFVVVLGGLPVDIFENNC